MKKRVIITAGGTGGHIYPAISLAQQLTDKSSSVELLFVGGKLNENRFFSAHPYASKSIDCGQVIVKNPLRFVKNIYSMCRGIEQSRRIIQQFSPDLIVGFGSYHTFPLLFAARLASIPFILHEANSIAGKVNRYLSKYAKVTGIYFPQSASLLRGPVLPIKIPLRKEFYYQCCTKEEARSALGLDPLLPTLLVFGGSQGARKLNALCSEASVQIKSKKWQIFHVTGHSDDWKQIQRMYQDAALPHCVKSFENQMNLAWKAADLAIVRAGAGTVAEAVEFEVPSILVPFPHATDLHQDKNADFLSQIVGGGVKLKESACTSIQIVNILNRWLDDSHVFESMRQAIHSYKKNYQWKELSHLVLEELKQ
jgi:UDP-N-acetylglucosamine--N-acetylmuramyl-(pentapeptide) pyrophosphoryl-undecaprenol N-acetylglucosamine transferase